MIVGMVVVVVRMRAIGGIVIVVMIVLVAIEGQRALRLGPEQGAIFGGGADMLG